MVADPHQEVDEGLLAIEKLVLRPSLLGDEGFGCVLRDEAWRGANTFDLAAKTPRRPWTKA
jgi:hypothetical protein